MNDDENLNPYESPRPQAGHEVETTPQDPPLNPSQEKLVVLSTFENSVEAHMFRNELEINGIDAKVANETTTAIFGATIGGPSSAFWIEVLVLESDAERALQIKNLWSNTEAGEDKPIPEWACACGETVDAGFGVCWSCQAEYKESAG